MRFTWIPDTFPLLSGASNMFVKTRSPLLMRCTHIDTRKGQKLRIRASECSMCSCSKEEFLWRCFCCEKIVCGYDTKNRDIIKHRKETGHNTFYNHYKKTIYCHICNSIERCDLRDIPIENQKNENEETKHRKSNNHEDIKKIVLKTPDIGLTNLGNTCFMNSALQILFHCGAFVGSILYEANGNDKPVTMSLKKFILEVLDTKERVLTPSHIHKQMRRLQPCFGDYSQQDSMDLIRAVLSSIHEETRIKNKESKNTEGVSFISDIFGGFLESVITCGLCNEESNKIDPIYDLSIEVSSSQKKGVLSRSINYIRDSPIELEECMDSFFSSETLQGEEMFYCEKCKRKTEAKKRLHFHGEPPNALIVQLKRFGNDLSFFSKISTKVNIEPQMNLKKYTADNSDLEYFLSGVIIHSGGLGGGHYTAYCKNISTEVWRCYNDSNVMLSSIEAVIKDQSYILLYQKKKYMDETISLFSSQPRPFSDNKYFLSTKILSKTFSVGLKIREIYPDYICKHGKYKKNGDDDLVKVSLELYRLIIRKDLNTSEYCTHCHMKTE
eukprot:GHVP01068448.1.p1 GENE.GHVP01068448.1~~GHVP01068448.1.p1  ORF type:complete len:554 (+),score=75.67 GHVP01068448.1:61-1722(+)